MATSEIEDRVYAAEKELRSATLAKILDDRRERYRLALIEILDLPQQVVSPAGRSRAHRALSGP